MLGAADRPVGDYLAHLYCCPDSRRQPRSERALRGRYAFTSSANCNGSAFGGRSGDNDFYDTALALPMLPGAVVRPLADKAAPAPVGRGRLAQQPGEPTVVVDERPVSRVVAGIDHAADHH
jgi:hypothetical protein